METDYNKIGGKEAQLEQLVKEVDERFIRSHNTKLYKLFIEVLEKSLIERVLERTDGNQLKAARILGINRNTLKSKIKKFEIYVQRWKI